MNAMTRRQMLHRTAAVGAAVPALGAAAPARAFDVGDHGAIGDGRTVNTIAIQAAIDACALAGGGQVVLQRGRYVTGTLRLKSHVTLTVETGASLIGSPDIADYATDTHHNMYANEAHMDRCLIFARDAENIGLEGRGTIDGQGGSFPNMGDPGGNRPMLIRFLRCRNIAIRDLSLRSPAAWTSAFLYCDDIVADALDIVSRVNGNGDGLDFDGCRNVRVANCRFDTSDDAICLQASLTEHPVRNVVITNCVMTTRWAAIRIGLLSRGDFEDVTVTNCVFHDIEGEGLKIQMNEGGRISNLLFSNIVMRGVVRPILMTFNSFAMRVSSPGEPPPMQSFRGVTFSNIRIEGAGQLPADRHSFIVVVGLPGHRIEDVVFSNVHFTAPGGGTAEDAARRDVPEFAGVRPESGVLGPALPSYGLFARHVKGLVIRGMALDTTSQDMRPAIVCDDVVDVVISDLRAHCNAAATSLIRLRDARDVFVTTSAATGPCRVFLDVEGAGSAGIGLAGNDLRKARAIVKTSGGAPRSSVTLGANLTGGFSRLQ